MCDFDSKIKFQFNVVNQKNSNNFYLQLSIFCGNKFFKNDYNLVIIYL